MPPTYIEVVARTFYNVSAVKQTDNLSQRHAVAFSTITQYSVIQAAFHDHYIAVIRITL